MKNKYLLDEDYDFIFDRVPRLCVDLVIKDRRGTLLTFRDIEPAKHKWHLPGGRVFWGESIKGAVSRIAKAETGLTVTIKKLLGYMEFPRERQNKKIRHSVSLVFLVESEAQNKTRGSWQGEEIKFFSSLPKNSHKTHGDFLKRMKVMK